MEREEVFEATHRLVLDLAASGAVDGLRIDHPDGLADPAAYFERLQQRYAQRVGLPAPPPPTDADAAGCRSMSWSRRSSPRTSRCPPDWAVHGTTGYRFANVVNGLHDRRQRQDAARSRLACLRARWGRGLRHPVLALPPCRDGRPPRRRVDRAVRRRCCDWHAKTAAPATSRSTRCAKRCPRWWPRSRSTAPTSSTSPARRIESSSTGRSAWRAVAAWPPTPACSTSCAGCCSAAPWPVPPRAWRSATACSRGACSSTPRRWPPRASRTPRCTVTIA